MAKVKSEYEICFELDKGRSVRQIEAINVADKRRNEILENAVVKEMLSKLREKGKVVKQIAIIHNGFAVQQFLISEVRYYG